MNFFATVHLYVSCENELHFLCNSLEVQKIDRQWAQVALPPSIHQFSSATGPALIIRFFSSTDSHYCFANCFSFGLRALAASRFSRFPDLPVNRQWPYNDIGKCIHPSIQQQPTGIFIVFAHAEYILRLAIVNENCMGLIGNAALLDWWENVCRSRKICILSVLVTVGMLIKITCSEQLGKLH